MIDFKNPAEVGKYIEALTEKKPLRHENYDASVSHAKEMSVHINGDPPGDLLDKYRPNEPQETHDYRLSIYQPITKSKAKKVINVISRIKNTKNFKINWDEEKRPRSSLIKTEDSLETFTREKYPFFKSFSDWVFMVVLKWDLVDPNGVIAWKPIGQDEKDYFIPFGHIFGSEDIWDYKVDEYYTLLTPEKSIVTKGQEQVREGNVLNVYTTTEVIELRQFGEISEQTYEIIPLFEYPWNDKFTQIPVVRLRGEYIENTFFLYESFISGILPFWNDAIREYSDKQATFVNHVFPERVEMQIECTNLQCDGGKVELKREDGKIKLVTCGICNGQGWVNAKSPFTNTTVRRKDKLDENDPIFPGVEYITKDTSSTELLVKDIENLIIAGFAALNMEFLSDVPLNQSGKAKEVDRTELYSFIQQISDNLFRVKKKSYWFINLWRYGAILNPEELIENMPEIIPPTNFDLVTSEMLLNKIQGIKESSPEIADTLEGELVEKTFPNDPDKREFLKAVNKLDPLRNMSIEEKNLAAQSGSVSKEDFIVSVNIVSFLLDLLEENEDFLTLDRKEKIKKLRSLAKKIINVNKTAKENTGAASGGDGQFGRPVRDED